MDGKAAVLFWIPVLIFLPCARNDYIAGVLCGVMRNLLVIKEGKCFAFGSV
jgi:hypothetical protein